MQPWDSGPAYNYDESFESICGTTLRRLGCAAEDRNVSTSASNTFVCACGSLQIDTLLGDTMMQEVNMYNYESLPVFENPIYLSVPLSIALVFISGKLLAVIAVWLTLPSVLGYLCAGTPYTTFLNDITLYLSREREKDRGTRVLSNHFYLSKLTNPPTNYPIPLYSMAMHALPLSDLLPVLMYICI